MRASSSAALDLVAILDEEAAVDARAARRLCKRLRAELKDLGKSDAGAPLPGLEDAPLRVVVAERLRLVVARVGRRAVLVAVERAGVPAARGPA